MLIFNVFFPFDRSLSRQVREAEAERESAANERNDLDAKVLF